MRRRSLCLCLYSIMSTVVEEMQRCNLFWHLHNILQPSLQPSLSKAVEKNNCIT